MKWIGRAYLYLAESTSIPRADMENIISSSKSHKWQKDGHEEVKKENTKWMGNLLEDGP